MTRRFLVVALPLLAAIAFVSFQLARRAASAASPIRPAAAQEPPSPIQSSSEHAVTFAPRQPPRLTRVPIRVPGLDLTQAAIPKDPPQWISLPREVSGGTTSPCQTANVGPVLVLRHYLAEQQWASLTAPDHKGPVLLRYEIIDAASLDLPYPFPELPKQPGPPYVVTALLYWADLAPQDRAAPLATYRRQEVDASGKPTTFVGGYGPTTTRVQARWMEYEVRPKEAHWRELPGRHRVVTGEAGWTVNEHPRLRGYGASTCGSTTNIVPVLDLSIARPVK